MKDQNQAIIIMIKERYFIGFSKKGRLQTAWSLPAAKFFAIWNISEVLKVEEELLQRKKKIRRYTINLDV